MASIEEVYGQRKDEKASLKSRLEKISKTEYERVMNIINEVVSAIISNAQDYVQDKFQWVTIDGKNYVCWHVYDFSVNQEFYNLSLVSNGWFIIHPYSQIFDEGYWYFTPKEMGEILNKSPDEVYSGLAEKRDNTYSFSIYDFKTSLMKVGLKNFGIEISDEWFDSELEAALFYKDLRMLSSYYQKIIDKESQKEYDRLKDIIDDIIRTTVSKVDLTEIINSVYKDFRGNRAWTVYEWDTHKKLGITPDGKLKLYNICSWENYQVSKEPASIGFERNAMIVYSTNYLPMKRFRERLLWNTTSRLKIKPKSSWFDDEIDELSFRIRFTV